MNMCDPHKHRNDTNKIQPEDIPEQTEPKFNTSQYGDTSLRLSLTDLDIQQNINPKQSLAVLHTCGELPAV